MMTERQRKFREQYKADISPLYNGLLHITVMYGVGIVGTFLLALWLAGHLHSQLNRLRSAAQSIASGDLTPPERERAANLEVAELQDAFITMAANLRATVLVAFRWRVCDWR